MPGSATRANALDHVVVVLFENRSLDNVLGRLYGPGDGKAFEGVVGKELSNPAPSPKQNTRPGRCWNSTPTRSSQPRARSRPWPS